MAVTELPGKVVSILTTDAGHPAFDLAVETEPSPVRCVGYGMVEVGDHVVCAGHWVRYPNHTQFSVNWVSPVLPATEADLQEYLASGKVRTVGPMLAESIVKAFGVEAIDVMASSPARLTTLQGIGPERAQALHELASEHMKVIKLRQQFVEAGLSANDIAVLTKRHKDHLLTRLCLSPYELIAAYPLFNFQAADQLADGNVLEDKETQRAVALIRCSVHKYERQSGMTATPKAYITEQLHLAGIDVDPESVCDGQSGISVLSSPKTGEPFFASRYRADTAKSVSEALADRQYCVSFLEALAEQQCKTANTLGHERYWRDVLPHLQTSLLLVDEEYHRGGLSWVAQLLRMVRASAPGATVDLSSMTASGADQACHVLKNECVTLHRLLGVGAVSTVSQRNNVSLPSTDILIVLEAHLLDQHLLDALLKGVPVHATVILVGDRQLQRPDELDPVWSDLSMLPFVRRLVLADQVDPTVHEPLLASLVTQAFSLDACGDVIDLLATLADNPVCALWTTSDKDTRRALDTVLPAFFDSYEPEAVQVITAGHRGLLGTHFLNRDFVNSFNPSADRGGEGQPTAHKIPLALGDRLRVHQNLSAENLRTGDVVTVTAIKAAQQRVLVRRQGDEVSLSYLHLSRMRLAFVRTAARVFLSPAPIVIIVLDERAHYDHHTQFLYSAALGAQSRVVIVGPKHTYQACLNRDALVRPHKGALALSLATYAP